MAPKMNKTWRSSRLANTLSSPSLCLIFSLLLAAAWLALCFHLLMPIIYADQSGLSKEQVGFFQTPILHLNSSQEGLSSLGPLHESPHEGNSRGMSSSGPLIQSPHEGGSTALSSDNMHYQNLSFLPQNTDNGSLLIADGIDQSISEQLKETPNINSVFKVSLEDFAEVENSDSRTAVADQPYRYPKIFQNDFREMAVKLKIFVYPHSRSEPFQNIFMPVDFEPYGNYASESYFKKALMTSNFITKNASEADLFYLPFSISRLRHDPRVGTDGVEVFVRNYIADIKQKWPFWNRTGGVDHFYVSCHSISRTVAEKIEELRLYAIQVVCSANYYLQGYVPHKDISFPQVWPRRDVPSEAKSTKQRIDYCWVRGKIAPMRSSGSSSARYTKLDACFKGGDPSSCNSRLDSRYHHLGQQRLF